MGPTCYIQPTPTWAEILARAKAALMAGTWESFYRETAQNRKEMRNIKFGLMDQARFIKFAEGEAAAPAPAEGEAAAPAPAKEDAA